MINRYDKWRTKAKDEGQDERYKECVQCRDRIYIWEDYYKDSVGDKFCSLDCLLESHDVRGEVLTDEDF